jgi:hypothetical protein
MWKIFWELYPNKLNESGAQLAFFSLTVLEMQEACASIEQWEVSRQWQDPQFIPQARNFIQKGLWKAPSAKAVPK